MIVVFDTNIFVSAFAVPGGNGERALRRIIEGRDSLALSKPILDELLTVLARKFAHDREQLSRTAVFLAELANFVSPTIAVTALDDEPDNRILECAAAAGADLIVTGDKAMLDLGEYEGIRIITLRAFLATE